jgi:hypothetical protein
LKTQKRNVIVAFIPLVNGLKALKLLCIFSRRLLRLMGCFSSDLTATTLAALAAETHDDDFRVRFRLPDSISSSRFSASSSARSKSAWVRQDLQPQG